tara:strand:- start:66 stop:239 length:174 start_codon:yes stop_codon:yes gene_type:complete
MDKSYSIDEILNAVSELQDIKKEKENIINKKVSNKKDFFEIPKNTLKLIEEAEKSKN